MDNEVGRAGFHVKHEFRASKRGAILDEMMRERIPGASERWAQQNPSIVLGDEPLNIALVNNGKGWFSLCKDPKKVLAYGEERLAKLSHRVKEPKFDPKKDKEWGGTKTSSMFVIHLPKTLCEEVKDFYPVLDDDGNDTGRKRSRWVARDRDEAVRYFKDVLRYLAEEVIPGGQEAILGADIQFSESTPHIQILADPFAPDPKHPGQLRSEFSRAYGQHRGVRDEKGKQIGGKAKLRGYQEGFRQRMVELGWPVELDVDPLRHDKTATKAVYGALKDQERALAEQEQNFAQNLAKGRSEIDAVVKELADEWENLDTERNKLKQEREQLQNDKQTALEEARSEGYAKGLEEGRAAVEREREQVQKDKEQVRKQLDQASALVAVAEKQGEPIPLVQMRTAFKVSTGMFADRLIAKGIRRDIVENVKEWADKASRSSTFEEMMGQAQVEYDRRMNRSQQLRQMVNESTEQLGSSKPDLDGGMEF